MKRSTGRNVLRNIVLIILCLIMCFPFFMMLSTSLKSYTEIKSPVFHLFPERIRWENYVELFQSGRWGRYFLNSFTITAISTAAAVIINSMAGYAFARIEFPFKNFIFVLLLSVLMVPGQIFLLPQYQLIQKMGLLNTIPALFLPNLFSAFGTFLLR